MRSLWKTHTQKTSYGKKQLRVWSLRQSMFWLRPLQCHNLFASSHKAGAAAQGVPYVALLLHLPVSQES